VPGIDYAGRGLFRNYQVAVANLWTGALLGRAGGGHSGELN
jgi:hypothetical protein